MTNTFSLETCKRLSELLEEPLLTDLQWVGNGVWDSTMQSDYETSATPKRDTWINAYTLQDLDGATWKKLGEKLGWKTTRLEENVETYRHEALEVYCSFLLGGMSEADKYLWNLIKPV